MKNTKIKARRMYENSYGELSTVKTLKSESSVFVLDASRYGEMVEQMASSMYVVRHPASKWVSVLPHARDLWETRARAALRSIGITKSK